MAKEKVDINIMFIGHVGSGKSTIASHLIYKLGGIDRSVLERFEKEAAESVNEKEVAKINKDAWVLDKIKSEIERGITIDKSVIHRIEIEADNRSFKYAWVLDKINSERERDMINLSKFETTKYHCTVIESPGQRDLFIETMLTRTSQPDCVLLVIDSNTGLDRQARALAHLSFVFGVKQIICCFNKMDATIPKYSKDRWDKIFMKLFNFLWMVGYKNIDTNPYVPISGFKGDNLIERSTNLHWYKGPILLEALDRINKADKNTGSENALAVTSNIESHCWELQPPDKRRMVSGPGVRNDENKVRSIVDEIKEGFTRKHKRAVIRAKEFSTDWGCPETIEHFKEENELEEELLDHIGACLGTLIKTFRESFLPFFEELSSFLTPMFGKNKTSEERRIAICIFVDVAEHCREAAHKYYGSFLPFLLEACNDECSDVQEAAAYGVGVCAEFGGSVFKPFVAEALSRLNAVTANPNADSAREKILQFHRDSISEAQVDGKATDLVKTDTSKSGLKRSAESMEISHMSTLNTNTGECSSANLPKLV